MLNEHDYARLCDLWERLIRQKKSFIHFSGIMMSSHSPPASTPLEPCRIAPYVNIPALRSNVSSMASSVVNSQPHYTSNPAAFFDPAILTAAHQVIVNARIQETHKFNPVLILEFTVRRRHFQWRQRSLHDATIPVGFGGPGGCPQ
jgi:hypothetical protein